MRIALISSEAVPFSKTGGLADVAGTLFKEYAGMGLDASLFIPLYESTVDRFHNRLVDLGLQIDIPIGKEVKKCRVFSEKRRGSEKKRKCAVYFVANKEYFGREELYGPAEGDYKDNDARFTFFCRSVLEICKSLNLRCDVLHCNDWQTALIPFYSKTLYRNDPVFSNSRTVLTIHNMGYQGLFPPSALGIAGLGPEVFHPEGVEFYGKVNFLKAGLISADILTTVSPTYAKEILSPDKGFGLDGVLRSRADALCGILNGIDTSEWNPASDRFLPYKYSKTALEGKEKCKLELMSKCSLTGSSETPLLCFIGRLSSQKGIGLLVDAAHDLMGDGANLFILGKGDAHFQLLLAKQAKQYPGRMHFRVGFEEAVAHLAYAGADIFLMPSLYEPCGLGQMIAMRYGTIPVAYSTGGLVDTIVAIDGSAETYRSEHKYGTMKETGFLFKEYSQTAFIAEVRKALRVYRQKETWRQFMANAMGKDFSWKKSASMYLELYGKPLT
ncbi:MAG: glycogen synthase [Dissulfurispiraceae bacterium]|jgi:starch synthase